MFNQHIISCILGLIEPEPVEKPWVDALRFQLTLDNNKLREHLICAMFDHIPTNGYSGQPDGVAEDGTPLDVKSGPGINFPDGGNSIHKKVDWVCLVAEYSKEDGLPIYVAEVPVMCIYEELCTHADELQKKGWRFSPYADWKLWVSKPEVKIIFKRPETYPTTPSRGNVVKRFTIINELPFEDKLVK